MVAYLCHESNDENGVVIESGAGWAARHKNIRGKGTFLRTSIDDDVDLDFVQKVWHKVTDTTDAEQLDSTKSTTRLLGVLEQLKAKKTNEIESTFRFGHKELILYALGSKFCYSSRTITGVRY